MYSYTVVKIVNHSFIIPTLQSKYWHYINLSSTGCISHNNYGYSYNQLCVFTTLLSALNVKIYNVYTDTIVTKTFIQYFSADVVQERGELSYMESVSQANMMCEGVNVTLYQTQIISRCSHPVY